MTHPKRALLNGITGQDGYQVHSIIRHTSTFNTDQINYSWNSQL